MRKTPEAPQAAWRAHAGVRAALECVLAGRNLTPNEADVLSLMSSGLSDEAIAERLALNELTVRVFGTNALMKLGKGPGLVGSLPARPARSGLSVVPAAILGRVEER